MEQQMTEAEANHIFELMISDFYVRELFGASIIELTYRMYGKKWEEEGYKFNWELDKSLEQAYKTFKEKGSFKE